MARADAKDPGAEAPGSFLVSPAGWLAQPLIRRTCLTAGIRSLEHGLDAAVGAETAPDLSGCSWYRYRAIRVVVVRRRSSLDDKESRPLAGSRAMLAEV